MPPPLARRAGGLDHHRDARDEQQRSLAARQHEDQEGRFRALRRDLNLMSEVRTIWPVSTGLQKPAAPDANGCRCSARKPLERVLLPPRAPTWRAAADRWPACRAHHADNVVRPAAVETEAKGSPVVGTDRALRRMPAETATPLHDGQRVAQPPVARVELPLKSHAPDVLGFAACRNGRVHGATRACTRLGLTSPRHLAITPIVLAAGQGHVGPELDWTKRARIGTPPPAWELTVLRHNPLDERPCCREISNAAYHAIATLGAIATRTRTARAETSRRSSSRARLGMHERSVTHGRCQRCTGRSEKVLHSVDDPWRRRSHWNDGIAAPTRTAAA
jgi:hypothetical protein